MTADLGGPAVYDHLAKASAQGALAVARDAAEAIRWNEWVQRVAVERAREQGASITELAAAVGLSYDAMRMRLRRRDHGGT